MSAQKKKKGGVADDDRNLVLVDRDFSDADLDDRIWLAWERYKKTAILGVSLLLLVGVSLILLKSLRGTISATLAEEYNLAASPEDKLAFAKKNSGEPLAALAALESADAAYEKGDYKEASARYTTALDLATRAKAAGAAVTARAAIGAAIADIKAGDTVGGTAKLTGIADLAPNASNAGLRAHALFLLAEQACGTKNFAAAKGYLDRLDRETPEAFAWSLPTSPKAELIRAFPELLTAAQAPVATKN